MELPGYRFFLLRGQLTTIGTTVTAIRRNFGRPWAPASCASFSAGSTPVINAGMVLVLPKEGLGCAELGYTGICGADASGCRLPPPWCIDVGDKVLLAPILWRVRAAEGATVEGKRCWPWW